MGHTPSTPRLVAALAALLLPLLALGAPAPRALGGEIAGAGAPTLVHDVDPAPHRPVFRPRDSMLSVGGRAYFAASHEEGEAGLWRTDGTQAGTAAVSDTPLAVRSLAPGQAVVAGGALFFVADDGSSGAELWRSDGTAAGTFLVRDIRPGPEGGLDRPAPSFGPHIVALGNLLLCAADDGFHGPELWRSDGTAAGTVMVKDLRPGATTWAPDLLTAAGPLVYFRTNAGAAGDTLWRSDGTAAGTVAVKAFPAAPFDSPGIYNLEAVGSTLFINYWVGIWRSDGTPEGTVRVDETSTMPGFVAAVNGRLIYWGNGMELRATDGTVGGAVALATFETPTFQLLGVGGGAAIIFVPATSSAAALWRSDGTPAGTFKLTDVQASGVAPPIRLASAEAGPLVFGLAGTDPSQANQLWLSDGTVAGTRLIHSTPGHFGALGTVAGGWVYTACDESFACSLMRTDGSAAGATLLVAGSPLAGPVLTPVAAAGGALFYTAGPQPRTLWRSDGTPQGATQVKTLADGAAGYFAEFEAVGPALYFAANDGSISGLWKSDGTPAGTALLRPATSGLLTAAQGALFFSSEGWLWRSDGSEPGTAAVARVGNVGPDEIVAAGGALFMSATGAENRSELWRSDGTPASAAVVKTFAPISCGFRWCGPSTARGLVAAGEAVFFIGRADGGQEGLWRSDGTPAGTVQLTNSVPAELTAVGDALFFTLADEAGEELWRSDGTPAGTARMRDILPGPLGSLPRELTAVDGALFFSASDGQSGRELWASDGTTGGTRLVADLNPGFGGSAPAGLTAAGATLFFSAWAPGAGRELWASESAAAGASIVADLAPGSAGSGPAGLTAAGTKLFFTADDGVAGRALWAAPVTGAPFRPTRVAFGALIQAEEYDRGGEGIAYHDRDPQNRGGRLRPGDGVDLAPETGAGGGHLVGWTQAGEWLNYTVDVAATRVYTLEVRVAAQGPGGVFHLALDGENWTGPLQVPDTGGWDRWATVGRAGLTLPAGRHTISLVMDRDGATWGVGNFDWLALRAPAEQTMLLPGVWR